MFFSVLGTRQIGRTDRVKAPAPVGLFQRAPMEGHSSAPIGIGKNKKREKREKRHHTGRLHRLLSIPLRSLIETTEHLDRRWHGAVRWSLQVDISRWARKALSAALLLAFRRRCAELLLLEKIGCLAHSASPRVSRLSGLRTQFSYALW